MNSFTLLGILCLIYGIIILLILLLRRKTWKRIHTKAALGYHTSKEGDRRLQQVLFFYFLASGIASILFGILFFLLGLWLS